MIFETLMIRHIFVPNMLQVFMQDNYLYSWSELLLCILLLVMDEETKWNGSISYDRVWNWRNVKSLSEGLRGRWKWEWNGHHFVENGISPLLVGIRSNIVFNIFLLKVCDEAHQCVNYMDLNTTLQLTKIIFSHNYLRVLLYFY